MSITVETDNKGKEYFEKLEQKLPGWIQFATGEDALKFKEFVKPWVYSSVGFTRGSGKLGQSIWAGLKKNKNGGFLNEWVIGPKPTSYNWVARWFPSSKKYTGFDHDFLHKAWDSFNASNNIKENIGKILQEKLDGLK